MDTEDDEDAVGDGYHMIAINVQHERSVFWYLVRLLYQINESLRIQ